MQITDAFVETCRGRKLKHEPSVPHKSESNLGMSDGLELELMLDGPAFCIFRAEKFSASGQVVKKRTHFDLRSRRFTAVAHDVDLAAIHDDFGASDRIRFASR